jgi:diguanylate cyclase (GGDEF)-like protein
MRRQNALALSDNIEDRREKTGFSIACPMFCFQVETNGTLLEFKGQKDSNLLPSEEILGKSIYDVIPSLAQPIMCFVEKALLRKDSQILESQFLVSANEHYYESSLIVCGENKVLAVVRDVTDGGKAAAEVEYLAHHDTLTNLPNRYLFKDHLKLALALAERKKRSLAILFLDLDNFKRVNETLGHNAGDELLQNVADRLSKCVRTTDSLSRLPIEELESIVARLGGDEFTILLSEVVNIQDAAIVSKRILKMLSEPFIIGSNEVFITASIGISMYPFDGKNIDTLLMNADVAMYQAKGQGKNNYQYYSESMNALTFERFTVENKLRRALEQNEFMLFYQPQVDLSTGNIIGVEALIRWLQPDLILIKPGDFIPMTEETGLIVPIGEWVLRTACRQNRAWQKAGFEPIAVTVNVSSVQFRQDDFIEMLSHILDDSDLDPSYLQLELTESTIMKHSENAVKKFHSLQRMGIQIAIDDFGTGYSSLNYLKRFPISTLKIDQSFIRDIVTDPDDQSIVKAIIALSHNLNMKVIAEGVETRKQLALLHEHECDEIQGHLICPPVSSDSIAQFIREKRYLDVLKRTGAKE